MILRAFAIALAAAMTLAPAAAAPPHKAGAAHVDWTRTVVLTPGYGFRMGNPSAKVRLIEYGSLTCPHCRYFEETGYKPLVENYVRSGRVSYEFRNLLLNNSDLAISLLAHCVGPSRFFPMAHLVYTTQAEWHAKLATISGDKDAIDQLPIAQQTVRYAELAGFPQMAAQFGLSPAQSQRCLTDQVGIDRLITGSGKAADFGVQHTPTFFINGKIVDVGTWEELEPLIRQAGG